MLVIRSSTEITGDLSGVDLCLAVPANARARLRELAAPLEDRGFTAAGVLRVAGGVSGVSAYSGLWTQYQTGLMFTVVVTMTGTSVSSVTLAVETAYPSLCISTATGTSLPVRPASWHRTVVADVTIPQLLALHEAECVKLQPSGESVLLPEPGGELQFIRQRHQVYCREMQAAGYFEWNNERECFVLTWHAARKILFHAGNPMRLIGPLLNRRRARRLLAQLGYGAFPVQASVQSITESR